MEYNFPQFRSLDNFNRHYMIVGEREFIEATQRSGEWTFQTVIAVQYPEILRIQDMLSEQFAYKKAAPEIERLFLNM